jgi:hypothetical protein
MGILRFPEPVFGWLVVVVIVLQAILEWSGALWVRWPLILGTAACVLLLAISAQRTGRLFLAVCTAFTVVLVATRSDWPDILEHAAINISFLAAFFSALTILRVAAGSSGAMTRAGTFLATQPPGKRYISLTIGTQVFALLLNFGAIQLLGTLSLASARQEPDAEIRKIRIRRMLLAIQRGFISALPWSPMAFSTAMAVSTIPGLTWATVALPGLVSSTILLGTGWAMDTVFKPKLTRPAPQRRETGLRPRVLLPLLALLLLMLVPVLTIDLLLGIRVVGAVLVIVPVISIFWIWLQSRNLEALTDRLLTYVHAEIPLYRNDLLLIMSAGYLGVVGAALLVPLMGSAGFDVTQTRPVLLLMGLLWIMPLFGQIGANPILTMSLVAPVLPPAADFGLTPQSFAVALLCGWALTGLTSPFTATNMLVGRFGEIKTAQVGWVWNRGYFLISVTLLSIWVLVHAFWIA